MDHGGFRAGALVSTLVSGALAAGALSSPPTANATCASFFGIGNSANCKSNLTSIAIAIGPNAKALALGYFGVSVSIGTAAVAFTPGIFAFATAVGDNAQSVAGGEGLNIALNVTPATTVPKGSGAVADGFGNIGVNLFGSGTTVEGHLVRASGILNTAMNLGGTDNKVWAGEGSDVLNAAFNALGTGNFVATGGVGALNLAFNTLDGDNAVIAAPGPLAIAGSIRQNGQATTKNGPGFNINGFKVGGAAAVAPRNAAVPAVGSRSTAASRSSGKHTAASGAGHTRGRR